MTKHAPAQPQPLLTRASVVTVVSALSALLVKADAGHVSAWLDANSDLIAGIVLAAGPAVTGLLARRHVTPVVSPKDNVGNDLVPAGSTKDVDAAARLALAQAELIYPSADPKGA